MPVSLYACTHVLIIYMQVDVKTGSRNASIFCTHDVIDIEGVYLIASNVSMFERNVYSYQQGLASSTGADIDDVEIFSWRAFNFESATVTAIASQEPEAQRSFERSSGSIIEKYNGSVTEMSFRVTIPRYSEVQARKSLLTFAHFSGDADVEIRQISVRGMNPLCRHRVPVYRKAVIFVIFNIGINRHTHPCACAHSCMLPFPILTYLSANSQRACSSIKSTLNTVMALQSHVVPLWGEQHIPPLF